MQVFSAAHTNTHLIAYLLFLRAANCYSIKLLFSMHPHLACPASSDLLKQWLLLLLHSLQCNVIYVVCGNVDAIKQFKTI